MLLVVAVSFLLGSTYANQTPAREDGRTEEYAIMHVDQHMVTETMHIRLTTSSGTESNNYKKVETNTLMIREIDKLNEQGYSLFDTNVIMVGSWYYYTYFFKRKL